MKFGMQIPYAKRIDEAIAMALALDKAGADVLWASEVYGFDAPTLLGFLAAKTSRVMLGSAILPIYSRSPALIAQTAAGLDFVSGGRAILGLGSSGPQVIEGWHGMRFDRPLGRTREIVDICRTVWRRDRLTHEGIYDIPLPASEGTGLGKPLKLITRPVREQIPIYLAAIGPANVELTAEIADGWLPMFFIPELAAGTWGDALAKGAARRSADLGALEVAATVPIAIGDGTEELRELGRASLALYIGGMGAKGKNFYNELACRYGYEAEAAAIQDLYLAGQREAAEARVPTELLEQTSLIGSATYVKERLAAFAAAGVTTLNLEPVGNAADDPAHLLATLRELDA